MFNISLYEGPCDYANDHKVFCNSAKDLFYEFYISSCRAKDNLVVALNMVDGRKRVQKSCEDS